MHRRPPSADHLTGGGGQRHLGVFDALPWNAGHITDFSVTADKLDLGRILASIGYTNTEPGGRWLSELQHGSDGAGDTQVFVNSRSASAAVADAG